MDESESFKVKRLEHEGATAATARVSTLAVLTLEAQDAVQAQVLLVEPEKNRIMRFGYASKGPTCK